MKNEVKIMLPYYKIIYSILFVWFLSIFRGVAETKEIGVTLNPLLAALSIVFMADTYLIDRRGQRWEIFALYALEKKKGMIYRRIIVQFLYLFLLAALGYFLFFIQNPSISEWENETKMYVEYLFATGCSIFLWGIMAIVFSNFFRNIWCGIGFLFVMWLVFNSAFGDDLLGKYNVFSYVFHNYEKETADWISGQVIGLVLAIFIMIIILPKTMKRRD